MAICQTSSTQARRVGNSGVAPDPYNDNFFVADEAPGRLDVEHTIFVSDSIVSVCIETTRNVGTVDSDGFLVFAAQHIEQGTATEILLLTIRARISALEVGGTFGVNGLGGLLDVEVFLNKDTDHGISLGKLQGQFGVGNDDWQEFELDVNIRNLKFPAANPLGILPAGNEITFLFTGTAWPIRMEIDWMTLEPKENPELAWRPVLLVHGLGATSVSFRAGTAWRDGLQKMDVGFVAVDLTPKGDVYSNGAELTPFAEALRRRFGVDTVHMLGHSKGAIDAREYVNLHDDIKALIMLGGPNKGSFIADIGISALWRPGQIGEYLGGSLGMSRPFMNDFNRMAVQKSATTYVGTAGDHQETWARTFGAVLGPNDDVVTVASVQALSYAEAETFSTADFRTQHSGLRFNTQIVDDLVPEYIGIRGTRAAPRTDHAAMEARRRQQQDDTGVQSVMSDAGLARPGETAAHSAVIDAGDAAIFLMLGDQDALRFELVTPTGTRITPTTTQDANIIFTSYREEGSLSYAGYHVLGPEVGTWTLEVIGTDLSSPDGTVYAVAAVTPLIAGSGVTLLAVIDRERYAVGDVVTITATFTDNDVPITGATIEAQVVHPGGTTTSVVLTGDALSTAAAGRTAGVYSGIFNDTAEAGVYAVVVLAERTDPKCTRQQPLIAVVVASHTALSGTFTDRGVDTDGDGLFNQLVVDVEVSVDVAATVGVCGTLTDGVGTTIQQVRAEEQLQPGPQIISLTFDGAALFALRHDGPYVLEDIVLQEAATGIGLGVLPSYTTAAYTHTQFQRPPCVLTGNTSDRGVHEDALGLMPYEALIVAVEVDMLTGTDVQGRANLYTEDGVFISTARASAFVAAGISQVEFRFAARQIFQSGRPGPYTLKLFSLWGAGISLRVPGIIAVTQPYAQADFAESTRFAIGGTVSGLTGSGLVLRDQRFLEITPGNGPFTFPFPVEAGEPYAVTIRAQPSNPPQICTVTNGSGSVTDANITNVAVTCVALPVNDALDPTFGPGGRVTTGPTGGALAIGFQSDGKVMVLGRRVLARYTSDGALDTSFGVNGAATVVFNGGVLDTAQGLAIQADDKIVVVGVTRVGSSDDFAIARFLPGGAPDTNFGTGGKTSVGFGSGFDKAWAVLVQSDGGLIVAGHASLSSPLGGDNDFALARLTGAGVLDTNFGNAGTGKVTTNIAGRTDLAVAAALQLDGKIVLAGRVIDSSGTEVCGLARYLENGTPDPAFGANGIATAHISGTKFGNLVAGVSVQPDRKILVAGSATAPSGAASGVSFGFALARFKENGQPDEEFGNAGAIQTIFSTHDDFGRALALQGDGKIVVAGETSNKLNPDFAVARYLGNGTLDSTFGTAGKLTVDFFGAGDQAACVAIDPNGRIVVAGGARNVNLTVLAMIRIAHAP